MKKIEFGQVIGIIANIGVIAGIAFLAVEIGQLPSAASNRPAVAPNKVEQVKDSMTVLLICNKQPSPVRA